MDIVNIQYRGLIHSNLPYFISIAGAICNVLAEVKLYVVGAFHYSKVAVAVELTLYAHKQLPSQR